MASILGIYMTQIFLAMTNDVDDADVDYHDPTVHDRFKEMAEEYDNIVDSDEWIMNLKTRRRNMVHKARGDVLESAVGTGRNMEFYDAGTVRSLTMVDRSEEMVKVAHEKWKKQSAGGRRAGNIKEVRFLVGDVEGLVTRPMETNSKQAQKTSTPTNDQPLFDTVLQTMGVCSTATPVRQLCALGELVKPENEGGRIYLLEHGRAHYHMINHVLDNQAGVRAKKMGCWWNRDIGQLIEKTGLEIVELKRYNFGTTWYVELKRPANWKGYQPGME
jgi:methyltransferase OMS1, mitochondrial